MNIITMFSAILIAILLGIANPLELTTGDVTINFQPTQNGINFKASTNQQIKLIGTLGVGKDLQKFQCINNTICKADNYNLIIKPIDGSLKITWDTKISDEVFSDCFDLKGANWYGGPQRRVQSWPLENMNIDGREPYVIKRSDNFGVAERYWLSSKGVSIYLDETVPLFVDQNSESKSVCFIAKRENPYSARNRITLYYDVVFRSDAKETHLDAINNYLGKPTGHPNTKMISEPIWTTWAKYKRDISESTVLEFAKDIRNHGYENGQLEIDDNWEKCYGAQEFTPDKFSDIAKTVGTLKDMNFRVSLWIHPFVNSDCQNNSNEGIAKGYFVANTEGMTNGSWWNSEDAHQIDFTNPEAVKWWTNRVQKLKHNPKIESFKFDAGETDYSPQPAVYKNVDEEFIPNIFTEMYVRTCARFGDLVEVRSAWRTQDLPIFVRMLDKDTSWTMDNGLPTLITTLLQLNMNGYTMVLPDMIGGNGYSGQVPTAELIVRWTQANTFMPAMQFSYLPWDITSTEFDAPALVKKFVNLHKHYSSVIIDAMKECIRSGAPVNPPIWWIDPTDPEALACNDEYLVGEQILVAPVIVQGATSRRVYLPKGSWRDGNNNTEYQGPISFEYAAPIDILPYFIKI
ncbi:myogenesis-regulating glycosidase isoform X2 [Leptinotarsa decemlineata]|uniref:myogenesis-regulating glycosidase isoform X2 n=1 Tax=Leptinotarsa decemlineata TaxID=7539 RepID=UPI003D308365